MCRDVFRDMKAFSEGLTRCLIGRVVTSSDVTCPKTLSECCKHVHDMCRDMKTLSEGFMRRFIRRVFRARYEISYILVSRHISYSTG